MTPHIRPEEKQSWKVTIIMTPTQYEAVIAGTAALHAQALDGWPTAQRLHPSMERVAAKLSPQHGRPVRPKKEEV